ncbi:TetR/AcrR family transcriptional regulator [Amaricoccus sp.]|uniref:TetR/AcrR family transcriptional regulator n=1 Tax=Amaricoccus sp. TaxID=1872485 RepID=UPI001B4BC803|nr:TetR/AcrR family transcriptional regulator [Amaricoccus sp.]MBP7241977.1 TetR/AcrR family transcriptional regulator [Amaricoccus sp.]
MPRITDARRAERRAQILDAARSCFQERGLHLTTMDDIIRASGLSAGAVYGYFASKEALILAAIAGGLEGIGALVAPILARRPPPAPAELAGALTAAIDRASAGGADIRRIAVLGWAEAQRDPGVRAAMAPAYAGFLAALTSVAAVWRDAGLLAPGTAPADAARVVLALCLGHVAQVAVLGEAAPGALESGLAGLLRPAGPS